MTQEKNPRELHEQDLIYIEGLKRGDSQVCHEFFYKEIGGILHRIRVEVLRGLVDFDEMVSELYLYLSRDRWSKLDGFTAQNGCRLRTWMVPVTWRFFVRNRENLFGSLAEDDLKEGEIGTTSDDLRIQIAIDINAILAKMPNRRYAEILRLLIIEGYPAPDVAEMLGMRVENVYNLKHRAIVKFIEMYGDR